MAAHSVVGKAQEILLGLIIIDDTVPALLYSHNIE